MKSVRKSDSRPFIEFWWRYTRTIHLYLRVVDVTPGQGRWKEAKLVLCVNHSKPFLTRLAHASERGSVWAWTERSKGKSIEHLMKVLLAEWQNKYGLQLPTLKRKRS